MAQGCQPAPGAQLAASHQGRLRLTECVGGTFPRCIRLGVQCYSFLSNQFAHKRQSAFGPNEMVVVTNGSSLVGITQTCLTLRLLDPAPNAMTRQSNVIHRDRWAYRLQPVRMNTLDAPNPQTCHRAEAILLMSYNPYLPAR